METAFAGATATRSLRCCCGFTADRADVSWTIPGLTTGARASIDRATAGAAPTTLHIPLTSAVTASLTFISLVPCAPPR